MHVESVRFDIHNKLCTMLEDLKLLFTAGLKQGDNKGQPFKHDKIMMKIILSSPGSLINQTEKWVCHSTLQALSMGANLLTRVP